MAQNEFQKLAAVNERYKIRQSKLKHLFNFVQLLILLSWAGLVQRFSLNVEDYPEVMTGGFFWFKDLTASDPYFILPMLNSFVILFTILVLLYLYNR